MSHFDADEKPTMNQLKRVAIITVMVGCLFYGVVFYVGTRKMDQRQTFTMLPVVTTTKLLYLVQTDSCLSNHLLSVETIGNAKSCHCDVLVLSFKQECSENPPEHVKYIYLRFISYLLEPGKESVV